jgi:hypothetical protein
MLKAKQINSKGTPNALTLGFVKKVKFQGFPSISHSWIWLNVMHHLSTNDP